MSSTIRDMGRKRGSNGILCGAYGSLRAVVSQLQIGMRCRDRGQLLLTNELSASALRGRDDDLPGLSDDDNQSGVGFFVFNMVW